MSILQRFLCNYRQKYFSRIISALDGGVDCQKTVEKDKTGETKGYDFIVRHTDWCESDGNNTISLE